MQRNLYRDVWGGLGPISYRVSFKFYLEIDEKYDVFNENATGIQNNKYKIANKLVMMQCIGDSTKLNKNDLAGFQLKMGNKN